MTVNGHFCWHIHGYSQVNKSYSCGFDLCMQYCEIPMYMTVLVQWDIHLRCGRHICSGVYANNVKHMYSGVPDCTFDCNKFKWGKYADIVVSYVHIN